MFLVLSGCVIPLAALISCLRMGVRGTEETVALRDGGEARAWSLSRWDGLAEEMTRRGERARPHCSDAATRRRHLAAVLPADARR